MPSNRSTARYSTGRVTPRKGATRPPGAKARAAARGFVSNEKWDVEESKHVRSGWVWRGFFMLTLLGIGVSIVMFGNHHATLGILWLVIAAGWFTTSMWLWRKHNKWVSGT